MVGIPHRVELQTWGTGPPNMFAEVALGRKILCARASMVDCDNVSSAVYKYESLLQQRMNKMGRSTSKLTILLTFASLLFTVCILSCFLLP